MKMTLKNEKKLEIVNLYKVTLRYIGNEVEFDDMIIFIPAVNIKDAIERLPKQKMMGMYIVNVESGMNDFLWQFYPVSEN